ncbi:YicC/YloC family endoribonuclease [Asticcacaulis sp.]|uniref:YicC/YloC family endoribonuclease n=1 Tax=Asticcacaulis sp. TaxID=1872648 RepID=UPI002C1936B7|nr:YicC/YloC family endoribonuclease [Asticcacaulis sp.]HTM79534.1 YicC/YloC family endoribonuclease [Asticcacaulis sp.]
MSLASMTGFARIEGSYDSLTWTLEMRSVNGRGLDIKYRFPAGFEAVEKAGRDLAKSRFQRGQMNLTVSVGSAAAKTGVTLNKDVLEFYLEASRALIDAGEAVMPSVDGLLGLRGVIEAAGDERADLGGDAEAALAADLAALFDCLKEARESEGRALEGILKGHLISMAACVERAKALADQQVEAIRERFTRRLNELLPEAQDFEERVLQEAALLATKADVREELDRLTSHLDQAHQLIDSETAPGRKLDFLAQEFMREANTLCSKSAFIELTQTGLELKAVIDQFREQTQNVE